MIEDNRTEEERLEDERRMFVMCRVGDILFDPEKTHTLIPDCLKNDKGSVA